MKRADKILTHLRQDGKKRLSTIAHEEGIAVSTVFEHVKKLQEVYITRHVPLLKHENIGYPFKNISFWKPNNQDIINEIKNNISVNNILRSSGEVFIIESYFKSMQGQEEFIESLKEKGKMLQTSNIIETIAQEVWTPQE